MSDSRSEILRVIREVLAPLIKADGGTLHVVAVAEQEVSLHLSGRFSGCPGNTLTTRRIIEPAIMAVAPAARVIVTSGAIIPKDATQVS